jgi:hypothetical protein
MIKNKPRVTIVIGKERKTRIGLRMLFRKASAIVKRRAFKKPLMCMPFIKYGRRKTKMDVSNSFFKNFGIDLV